jgi:hypothetical protein
VCVSLCWAPCSPCVRLVLVRPVSSQDGLLIAEGRLLLDCVSHMPYDVSLGPCAVVFETFDIDGSGHLEEVRCA